MWLEQLDFFSWSALKTLTIPQRVGGTGKKKGTIVAIAELPPQGVKSESEWRDELCWVGMDVGRKLQSHVHDRISHSEKCYWHIFFLLGHADYWRNISGFCLFSQHIVWRRVTKAGNSFETEAKIKTSQGGLISVFLNVYMWIIYLSSGRKWGTITSLGKKGRKTNRWYLVPSFGFLAFSPSPFLFSEAVDRVRLWTDGKGQWQEEDSITK